MTNGSSQGLFVIVAVVIFGIFVGISMLIFEGNLQSSLASIFKTSIEKSTEVDSGVVKKFTEIHADTMSYDSEKEAYKVKVGKESRMIRGLRINENIVVPYGYGLVISFDVLSEKEAYAQIDYNNRPLSEGKTFCESKYDCYYNQDYTVDNEEHIEEGIHTNTNHKTEKIEANTWHSLKGKWENTHPENLEKLELTDWSSVGVAYNDKVTDYSIYIKNVKWRLYKVQSM